MRRPQAGREILARHVNILPTFRRKSPNSQHQHFGRAVSINILRQPYPPLGPRGCRVYALSAESSRKTHRAYKLYTRLSGQCTGSAISASDLRSLIYTHVTRHRSHYLFPSEEEPDVDTRRETDPRSTASNSARARACTHKRYTGKPSFVAPVDGVRFRKVA